MVKGNCRGKREWWLQIMREKWLGRRWIEWKGMLPGMQGGANGEHWEGMESHICSDDEILGAIVISG